MRNREEERIVDAFKVALERHHPDDLESEARLYEAALAVGQQQRYYRQSVRVLGGISKQRWRRGRSDIAALIGYLGYLSTLQWWAFGDGTASQNETRQRLAIARSARRFATIISRHVPRAPDRKTVEAMQSFCASAALQFTNIGRPHDALAAAELSLRYARGFVLWDRTHEKLLVEPLRDAARAALASANYQRAVEHQREFIRLTDRSEYVFDQPQAFTFGEVEPPVNELFLRVSAGVSSVAQLDSVTREVADAYFAVRSRMPSARVVGETYRLLGQAHAGLGEVDEAMRAFNIATRALRSDLGSAGNRLLALKIDIDALNTLERAGAHADYIVRLRSAFIEAEALKAHAKVDVPEFYELRDRLARTELQS